MAGTSLFLLLDDIASTLDDVATMTKIATRKTAGVLGDDLALNAEQVSGVRAERELPVVWAVAKGSMLNKLILVPAALAISALAPWLIGPLLMLGGAYLCFEGFEKLAHKYLPGEKNGAHRSKVMEALADPTIDLVAIEKNKIKGAVRTDFVLSAEIIVIALGVVGGLALSTQVAVLVSIAVMMTIGVYGLVAGIVKLDDLGLWLCRRANAIAHARRRRHSLGRAMADAIAVGDRHRGDVSGGRRHPQPWIALGPSPDRVTDVRLHRLCRRALAQRARRRGGPGGRGAGVAPRQPGQAPVPGQGRGALSRVHHPRALDGHRGRHAALRALRRHLSLGSGWRRRGRARLSGW
ncbi:hypothetical protein MASR2M16_22540 [Thauera terpenica]